MVIFLPFLALISLVATALGQASTSYKTATACTTKYGISSASPTSSGYTITVPLTFFYHKTTTLTSTITPPVYTITVTTTSIITQTQTKSGSTRTVTPTTTTTQTVRTTVYPSTTTISTTVTPATYTVPTRSGFTPIASAPGYIPKKRSLDKKSAMALRLNPAVQRRAQAKAELIGGHDQKFTCSKAYPTATVCATVVEAFITSTKTYTASTKTTLPASTLIITSTATKTTTICGAPVTTTQTVTAPTSTATTTVTSTSTGTATATVTVLLPTPTVYAQCQPNNIISRANGGRGIDGTGISVDEVGGYQQSVVDTVVQCCEACASIDFCTAFTYDRDHNCAVAVRRLACEPTYDAGYYQTGNFPLDDSLPIGQGQCGTIRNNGNVDSYNPS